MMLDNNIDFDQTVNSLILANTPLFLVRKLTRDSAVRRLLDEAGPEKILEQLRKATKTEPKDILEKAIIYAHLVALSLTDDVTYLQQASELSASHLEWFNFIAKELLARYRPTTFSVLTTPPSNFEQEHNFRVSNPSTRLIIP